MNQDLSEHQLSLSGAELSTEDAYPRAAVRHLRAKTKRSNERRAWQEQESGPPVVPESFTTWRMTAVNRYDLDARVEPVTKKLREPTTKSVTKNRGRRTAKHLKAFSNKSETDTLRLELVAVHKSYKKIFQDQNEKIARDLEDYKDAVRQNYRLKKEIVALCAVHVEEVDDIQNDLEITEEELTISQKSEKEWIGRAIKLKFIFDQMKKIGALPEDHAEWVDPMVEDIEIPEVSIAIRDEFVPTAQTDNTDWVSSDEEEYETFYEEGDIIGEYLVNETSTDLNTPVNCSNCGEMTHATSECLMPQGFMSENEPYGSTISDDPTNREVDEHGTMMNVFVPRIEWNATAMYNYRPLIPDLPAILEKSATTIQKAWRNHQILKKEKLDRELDDFMYCRRLFNKWEWDSDGFHDDYATLATCIQRVWRGHHLRKLLEAAIKDRFHQGHESMRAEAYLAHNVYLYYAGYHFPAEKL